LGGLAQPTKKKEKSALRDWAPFTAGRKGILRGPLRELSCSQLFTSYSTAACRTELVPKHAGVSFLVHFPFAVFFLSFSEYFRTFFSSSFCTA